MDDEFFCDNINTTFPTSLAVISFTGDQPTINPNPSQQVRIINTNNRVLYMYMLSIFPLKIGIIP